MKEIITSKGTFLFVEVPDSDNYKFKIENVDFGIHTISKKKIIFNYIKFEYVIKEKEYYFEELLGKNNYEIISTTKDITEEQAESIVQYFDKLYLYLDYNGSVKGKLTAKSSLQSLIQANGLSLEKNYLILKKN